MCVAYVLLVLHEKRITVAVINGETVRDKASKLANTWLNYI